MKKLKKIEERLIISTLKDKAAQLLPKDAQEKLRVADGHFRIGDALEEMRDLAEFHREQGSTSSIALVECDPPYAVDLHEKKEPSGAETEKLTEYEEITPERYPLFLQEVAKLTFELAGNPCWLVWWFGIQWYSDVKIALLRAGWDINPIPGIWVKDRGQTLSEEVNLANSYETFFVARKGYPLVVKRGRRNVFEFPTIPGQQKFHLTQKPVALYQEILETFTLPGSIIMSPFLGSGAVLRAAYKTNSIGFGWDKSQLHKDYFLKHVVEDMA